MLKFKRTVHSKTDNTIKYVFYTNDNLIIEFSYIDKNDGKDIICVPSQTMCAMGCRFCHTAEYIGKIKNRNLLSDEISEGVEYMYNHLGLDNNIRTLLISFMGCGEPIFNFSFVIEAMRTIQEMFPKVYTRFAVCTSLPKIVVPNFFMFTNSVQLYKLPVKLHISLHYTTDKIRNEWMPNSLDIVPTIKAAEFFKAYTGNPVEVHYALLEGVNDSDHDAYRLGKLLYGTGFNVKFLHYNRKENLKVVASGNLKPFEMELDTVGIQYEYYCPPGLDIGASCGQFLMDEYTAEKTNEQIISEHDNKLKNEIATITDNSVLTEMQKKINQEKI